MTKKEKINKRQREWYHAHKDYLNKIRRFRYHKKRKEQMMDFPSSNLYKNISPNERSERGIT